MYRERKIVSVTCMGLEYDSYFERNPKHEGTVILSRTEAEVDQLVAQWTKIYRWPKIYKEGPWPERLRFRSALRCPFNGGVMALSDSRTNHFSQRDAKILERFAEAFSLGYARHLDFRGLEKRNRELQVGESVARVGSAVAAMTSSADIFRVMILITEELEALGLKFTHCGISVIDEKKQKVRTFTTPKTKVGKGFPDVSKWMTEKSLPFGPDAIDRIEKGEQLGVFDLPGAEGRVAAVVTSDYQEYLKRNPNSEETVVLSRTEEETRDLSRRWEDMYDIRPWPEEWMARSTMRCPFKGGAILLSHTSRNHFTDNEARILERFAEAFSFGYTRFLDFRRLERRNRALQISGAVANVQSAVAAMTSSADIVRVMTIITQELENLGLDFTHCSISVFDEKSNKVRAYTAPRPGGLPDISNTMVDRSHPFGPDTIDRIENGEVVAVSNIPGAEDRVVAAVTYDYTDYLKRNPKKDETVILSRTEEEARALGRRWEDMYGMRPWPEEWLALSSMRCPFREVHLPHP